MTNPFSLRLTLGAILASLICIPLTAAAELDAKAVAAFDRYVTLTESRMATGPFLLIDGLSGTAREHVGIALKGGDNQIDRLTTRDGTRDINAPGGLIHHWVGTTFVPGVGVEQALALLQAYDTHAEVYAPNVARARLLDRSGDRFRVHLRFAMTKVITVVVNSEHVAEFTRPGNDRAEGRIHSVRIAEVENPGSAAERELPPGKDGGYLWRLNSYWRVLARDGGVYIQCESISLTRGIPMGLGWLVGPFVTSIPRESLTFTLEATRRYLASRR